eukprot:Anaeramoba_ignava/a500285_10.p2 GENE.a500285_10~~a500285_10.p2  ORF type:complete len:173 (-),score=11.55 a500285_10:98-616(-)
MKNLVKIIAVVVCVLVVSSVSAQTTPKFGHIESNKLMSIMPDMKAAQTTLQQKGMEFEKQLNEMKAEYQKLIQAFQAGEKTMSDVVKATKVKEIQDAEQRIGVFNQHAQQTLAKAKEDLLKPIIEKSTNAIKEVGKENGFIYIFDLSAGNVLYFSNQSVDVLPLVKKKLGIQ